MPRFLSLSRPLLLRALLLCTLFVLSCSRALTPAPHQAPPQGGEASQASVPSSERTHKEEPGKEPEISAAKTKSRFLLSLPVDRAFLETPLPPEHLERYRTFQQKKQIQVGRGYLYSVELLTDGSSLLVASGEERSVRIYERGSGRLLRTTPIVGSDDFQASALGWPELVAGLGPSYVTASPRGITLVSAKDGSELALLSNEPADALVFSPDRRILITETSQIPEQTSVLRFYVREGSALSEVGLFSFEERVDGVTLSRDNRLLALSHYPSDDVRVIDLGSGEDILRVAAPRYAGSVDFSPDGRFVAVGGEGLLVVDLLNPDRRAYYDALSNNINTVRFSPSGDALAVSAYDGRVRILSLTSATLGEEGASHLRLHLEKELRHAGTANVYGFSFDTDGDGLVSASGDQTVRWFRGVSSGSEPRTVRRFQSLSEWRTLAPSDAARSPAPPPPRLQGGILVVPASEAPPRPTRLAPGAYDCKITKIYRMRDCSVESLPSGHTWLRFAPDNLFALSGIVYDDGDVIRFEGSLTEPSSVMDCRDCEKQPVHGVLRQTGGRLEGILVFRTYYDPFVPPELPPKSIRFEEATGRYPIELKLRKTMH